MKPSLFYLHVRHIVFNLKLILSALTAPLTEDLIANVSSSIGDIANWDLETSFGRCNLQNSRNNNDNFFQTLKQ